MKKVTLLFVAMIIAFGTFAQLKPQKMLEVPADKLKAEKTARSSKDAAIWEVTFEEATPVWTLGADTDMTEWMVSDAEGLPSSWIADGGFYFTPLNEVFADAGNWAWLDMTTDPLNGTPQANGNTWIQFDDIDLSTANGAKLMFKQSFRAFNPGLFDVYVDVSVDDGATWVPTLVNDDVPAFESGESEMEIILDGAVANQADVTLRFRWETVDASEYPVAYGWQLDDIKIVAIPDNDLKLVHAAINFFEFNESYYHTSSNYGSIPEEQFASEYSAISFSAIVENYGVLDVEPVMNVKVLSPEGVELYNESVTHDVTLSLLDRDTVNLMTDFSMPSPVERGEYTVITEFVLEGEDSPVDNVDTTYFNVSDNAFTRDLDNMTRRVSPSEWVGGHANGERLGVDYMFLHETEILSMDVFIDDATTVGTSIVGYFTQWVDGGQSILDLSATPMTEITEEMLGTWVHIDFPDPVAVTLEDGVFRGIASVGFVYGDDGNDEINIYIGADPSVNASFYGALWMFYGEDVFRYIPNWDPKGVGIRVNTSDKDAAVGEINADQVAVYPNPSNGTFKIENVRGADVEVFNLMGQRVFSAVEVNENLSIDLSDLSEGTYVVRISGENTVKTQKINIVK